MVCFLDVDIEKDVTSLRTWVNTAEKVMSSLCFSPDWSLADIRAKLAEHQVRIDFFAYYVSHHDMNAKCLLI
jgi:hypothetical protein